MLRRCRAPYVIVYELNISDQDEVMILAVRHAAQNRLFHEG